MDNRNKADKKLRRAWSMYDWANSAYNLVITTTIFPAYFLAISGDGSDDTLDFVDFHGFHVINSVLLNYALATAYLIIAFISPILSSIADYKGNKKRFMQLFCYIGSLSCCGLFFFGKDTFDLGIILAMIAAIGWCGSLVFYNAFLPEIAKVEDRDKVSAQGYSYGYVGSVILQMICLVFVLTFPDSSLPARFSFLLVGLWWLGFAQIPFRVLPLGTPLGGDLKHSVLSNGFRELRKVWKQVQKMPVLKTFLPAFFFYSMGVQTVMLASAEFVHKEIFKKNVDGELVPMGQGDLIITIIIIQLVAIAGAMLMSRLSRKLGNIKVLMIAVLIWIGICFSAYFIHTNIHFYFIAVVIGLVMGGIQSMSRSTYSKMMPETQDTTSFFSFYDVTEKVAISIGLFSFGFMEHITGSMRNSIFALGGFFVIGFFFLLLTNHKSKLVISQ